MTHRDKNYTEYDVVAEFYDYVEPYRTRRDVGFYVDEARAAAGPVLEVGCGTGRILLPTAQAGVTITGLDLSAVMLNVCRTKLAAMPEDVQSRVTLVQGTMRDFDLGTTFSLITAPFRGFQHLLTIADQIECLHTLRRHLQPDGRLILDLFNPSLPALTDPARTEESGDEPEFTMPDGRRVLRRFRITERDYLAQVNHVELIYYVTHPDGRTERLVDAFPMRYLFRYEAEHLLERCGLYLHAVYGDYDKSAFGTQYPGELILVAGVI